MSPESPTLHRPSQGHIDGFEPPRIAEIDEAAEEYRCVRDERMGLQQEEAKLKAKLLLLMQEHELTIYPIPDTEREVCREHGEDNVKVRKRQPVDTTQAAD